MWLNTPRRPREASGTSGQKAALCGVPNFSVLDGWWVEGYDGENGWVIGEDRSFKDEETQDDADADSLYHTLEEEIIPLFFDRDASDVPTGWVRVMKNSIESCAPAFSMQRMLIDYVEDYYLPAAASGQVFVADGYADARGLAAWKQPSPHVGTKCRSGRSESTAVRPRGGRVGPFGQRTFAGGDDGEGCHRGSDLRSRRARRAVELRSCRP